MLLGAPDLFSYSEDTFKGLWPLGEEGIRSLLLANPASIKLSLIAVSEFVSLGSNNFTNNISL